MTVAGECDDPRACAHDELDREHTDAAAGPRDYDCLSGSRGQRRARSRLPSRRRRTARMPQGARRTETRRLGVGVSSTGAVRSASECDEVRNRDAARAASLGGLDVAERDEELQPETENLDRETVK